MVSNKIDCDIEKEFESHYGQKPKNYLKKLNFYLVRSFFKFGYKVGCQPLYFIIVPFLLTLVLVTGVLYLKYEEEPSVLFVPFVSPFTREKNVIEKYFPVNYTHFYDPSRFIDYSGHVRIYITAKDGGSILRSQLWPEIFELDEKIRNLTINDDERIYEYEDLCCRSEGHCIPNIALNVGQIVGEIENGSTQINYPLMVVPLIVPQILGGITVNKTAGLIEDAKGVMLVYFFDVGNPEKKWRAHEFERVSIILLKQEKPENVSLTFFTSRTLKDELKRKMESCIPYIPVTGFIMVTVCMGLLWTKDSISSKPLIGVIAIISALMSAGSAFGLLSYTGMVYTRLNTIALFLVLGIGVDDVFVAISAWQKTSIHDSVPKRLACTYADAAVSVTITSLTNALSFAVGISTPTLIVMNFCLYSCVSIIFAYFYFVTFCGGFLAVSGYMEEKYRHCLFLVKVKDAPEEASKMMKKLYSVICASTSRGINARLRDEEHEVHCVSAFFGDVVAPLLRNNFFKSLVLISYIAYLGGALYGLTILKEGMLRERMGRDDSYLKDFTLLNGKYFRTLPYRIQIILTGNLTYSDPEVQEKIEDLHKKFENSTYASDPVFTQSWIRSFMKRLRRRKVWQEEIVDEKSFIKILREKFLKNRNQKMNLDIVFNEDNSRIVASRFLFQTENVKDVYEDVKMMEEYRQIARESEFNVTTFNFLFSLFDQHALLRPMAVQSITIAAGLVIAVSLIFIPDVRGSFAIAYSVLSIAVGVLGYMAYWNINLDHVATGSIFMCIGFSVDFSAHITYTYLSSKEKSTNKKIRHTLHHLGLPILQGGITTVLSLLVFLFIPGYGYRTFFKTIFLVTLFASYHSLILIPLVLSKTDWLCDYCGDKNKALQTSNEIENGVTGKTFKKICTEFSSPIPEIESVNDEKRMYNNEKTGKIHNHLTKNIDSERKFCEISNNDFIKLENNHQNFNNIENNRVKTSNNNSQFLLEKPSDLTSDPNSNLKHRNRGNSLSNCSNSSDDHQRMGRIKDGDLNKPKNGIDNVAFLE